MRSIKIVGIAALFMVAIACVPAAHGQSGAVGSKPVIALYYPWYETSDWTYDRMADLPPEPYSSGDDAVIARHIQQADDSGIDGFACTWYGPNESRLNERCGKLLRAAEGRDFGVAFFPDQAADFTGTLKTPQGMVDSLGYLRDTYMGHPNYMRWNGKPLLVFWNPQSLGGVDTWREVRRQADPNNEWFWLGEGTDFGYLDVFDGLYYFDITWAAEPAAALDSYLGRLRQYNSSRGASKPAVATVMPGYDDSRIRNTRVRDRENGNYYRRAWQAAVDSNAAMTVITSWNEWFEGHQIEPSRAYGNLYLDITREYTSRYKGAPAPAPGGSQTFPETGQTVSGRLLEYWNGNGGLEVFGLPLTAEDWQDTSDGRFRAQLFERNRLELHPENARPYDVLLGRLGTDLLNRQGRPWETLPREEPSSGCRFFAETGHNLCEPFLSYWRSHGLDLGDPGVSERESLALFGYPVTAVASETNPDGWTGPTQWFERARFEEHAENEPRFRVLLGRLGAE